MMKMLFVFVAVVCLLGKSVMPTMAAQKNHPKITRTATGVSLVFDGLATAIDQEVTLDVITDQIIHVVARPVLGHVAASESLIIIDSLLLLCLRITAILERCISAIYKARSRGCWHGGSFMSSM